MPTSPREPARIRAFYVHPAHARRGLGRIPYEHCGAAARAAGLGRLELVATLPGEPVYRASGVAVMQEMVVGLSRGSELRVRDEAGAGERVIEVRNCASECAGAAPGYQRAPACGRWSPRAPILPARPRITRSYTHRAKSRGLVQVLMALAFRVGAGVAWGKITPHCMRG